MEDLICMVEMNSDFQIEDFNCEIFNFEIVSYFSMHNYFFRGDL